MVKQLGLFSHPTFNNLYELKCCMAAVVQQSGLSRDEFLDRMNRLAERFGVRLMKGNGRNLTKATFEKWLNPNNTEHIPSPNSLSIFCEIGNTIQPLQILANPIGAWVIDEQEAKLLRWAKEYQKAKAARQAMKKLESEI